MSGEDGGAGRVRSRRTSGGKASPPGASSDFVTTVHTRGQSSLDGMLALAEIASRDSPLDEVLNALASTVALLLGVDVCSIYLREEAELVLRATHGFPKEAIGAVRMRVGEGLTGFAVECLRPVSVAKVTIDARNKRFDALGEERFPALCALPLVDDGRAVGALVVQRRQARAFGPREVVLIAAMAPPLLLAIERARRRRSATVEGASLGRPQEVTLRGAAGAPGRGLGVVAVRRAHLAHLASAAVGDVGDERARLGFAFAEVAAEVAALDAWASPRLDGAARSRLSVLRFVLEDARLRGRAFKHLETGASATTAIERVARQYVRVLANSADETLRERSLEIEALATRLVTCLVGGEALGPAPGRVLVATRLTVFEVVGLAASHGAGAALTAPLAASPGVPVARALDLPVACDVKALFQWAADGDRALVDGDTGVVLLNPSRGDVAAHRRSD